MNSMKKEDFAKTSLKKPQKRGGRQRLNLELVTDANNDDNDSNN